MIKDEFLLSSVGDRDAACAVARKSAINIPAYREYLRRNQFSGKISRSNFEELPLTDKENYLMKAPYFSLLPPENLDDVHFVFKSSGSSGKSFYWPQLKQQYKLFDLLFEDTLSKNFSIRKKRTAIIVGLSLGSWIGGDLISWAAKNVALRSNYSLTVFSPGNQHEEILEIINGINRKVDQIILFVCPSTIGHLALLAEEKKFSGIFKKLRFLVIGEPFSENFRLRLRAKCKVKPPEVVLTSVYGSADTGIIGIESNAVAFFRELLSRYGQLRRYYGFENSLPNFFNLSVKEAYIEMVKGELVFTAWQGLPLMRYNLHDNGSLIDWNTVKTALKDLNLDGESEKLKNHIIKDRSNPIVIAVGGRSDGTIYLCGTNISESMLSNAINDKSLQKTVTGHFYVSVLERNGRQQLKWEIELKPGIRPDKKTESVIYAKLIELLGKLQPEFMADYNSIYSKWDDNESARIFQFKFYPWPQLSRRPDSAKHRIIALTEDK